MSDWREELIETIALQIGRAQFGDWVINPTEKMREQARAALAVAEPVIREQCAGIAEKSLGTWGGQLMPSISPTLFGREGRMGDIIEKLREYAQHAETRSERDTFEATINEITILREDLASAKQAAAAYEAWKFPKDIQALTVENERLLEENARLRKALEPFAARLDELEKMKASKYACATSVEIEHLRAARAAIREGGKE